MIIPTLARTEWIVNHPSEGSFKLVEGDLKTLERWTWCDALFMAPPVYAKLYMLTGEKKYIKFMNREYKATYDYLFDKEENCSTVTGVILISAKPMARKSFGDVATVGCLVVWLKY